MTARTDTLWGDTSATFVLSPGQNALMWADDYLDCEEGDDQMVGGAGPTRGQMGALEVAIRELGITGWESPSIRRLPPSIGGGAMAGTLLGSE
ncbi:MAG: hypothetical protein Q7T21_02605 [Gallionella sp.]|nr:hypothetical protein [Gallionella sp.]